MKIFGFINELLKTLVIYKALVLLRHDRYALVKQINKFVLKQTIETICIFFIFSIISVFSKYTYKRIFI